jgi:glucose/arabinose dehydrogenase
VEPKSGRLFLSNVGGSAWEEVSEVLAGENYGWRNAEGVSSKTEFRNPLYAYPPGIGSCISGGAFAPWTGRVWPEPWAGKVLFVDCMANWMKALDPSDASQVQTFATGLAGPVAIEFDVDGSILILQRNTCVRDGKKFRENTGSLVRVRYTETSGESEVSSPEKGLWAGKDIIAFRDGLFPGCSRKFQGQGYIATGAQFTTVESRSS